LQDKRIKGIITVDDIIDVIKEENTEDMYKFGAAGGHTEEYISAKPSSIAKHRVTWLLILVVTGFISGGILENFSFALKRVIALSFFIPLLMDSAGNAGTQAATVMVRGLAVGEIRIGDIWRVARKELAVGTMLGIVLGALALARALVLQKSPLLGLTVGISMLATVTVSTCLGSILPLICKRLGADPAIVSATSYHNIPIIKYRRLTRGNRPLWLSKLYADLVLCRRIDHCLSLFMSIPYPHP